MAIVVVVFTCAPLFAPRAKACAFTDTTATFRYNGEQDFNDWGLILKDARGTDYWCRINAHYRLLEKLNATPDSYWQGFLSGEYVMLVMASGLALGGSGSMTPALDARIKCVIDKYRFAFANDVCGWSPPGGVNHANTCMDDYAIAASAYGWITAYLRLSGRDWTGARWQTLDMIHRSFNTRDAVCIFDLAAPLDPVKGPCNACGVDPAPTRDNPNPRVCANGLDRLDGGTVKILSLNDGIQTPPYGIGLIANIAAAFMGLEVARAPIDAGEINADERKILQYIWVEAQQHSETSGSEFLNDCYHVDPNPLDINGEHIYNGGFYCCVPCKDLLKSDANAHYRPVHYPLNTFYGRYGFERSTRGYAFNLFVNDYTRNDFWNAGRGETYSTLADTWFRQPIGLSAGSGFRMAFRAPNWWPTYFMNTQSWGGGVVNATSDDAMSPDSQFIIVDLNGGHLNDGDPVGIQLYYSPSYWLSAENGGGGQVTATATSVGTYERFTIRKLAGLHFFGPIANGDNIALQTASGYYLHVDGGGGSTIAANGMSAGTFETFNYVKVDNACAPPPPR